MKFNLKHNVITETRHHNRGKTGNVNIDVIILVLENEHSLELSRIDPKRNAIESSSDSRRLKLFIY